MRSYLRCTAHIVRFQWRNVVLKFEGATSLLIAIVAQALVVGVILTA
ncbi:hypothetical protein Q4F19_05835 [Sphingomonas sp. BIUV-7]|uniref:Uncharacterized protein n=1 Tax=Sphingomonas natans TaxID=3063330 RepID=A0ABT8Y877_9SPHN|nr:hypothetical protein [Sphingomonas sp. BIUV-7]MDO6413895.1 hypothetical protein [Sphingomonas sp. BIUV-7]